MKRVTVIGGTGLVGAQLVRRLSSSTGVSRVTMYARGPRPSGLADGVEHVPFPELDYFTDVWEGPGGIDRMSQVVAEGLVRGDALVSCLGTTRRTAGSAERFRFVDYAVNAAFALAARRAGYAHYSLVSAYGANASSRLLYPATKGRLEDFVRTLGFSTVDIYRPGLLVGHRDVARFGESLTGSVLGAVARALPGLRHAPYMKIDGALVAGAIATRIERPPGGHHTLYNVDITNASKDE